MARPSSNLVNNLSKAIHRIKDALSGLREVLAADTLLKMMKNAFWSCRKKGLIRKIKLTSKFMTSQPD